MADSISLPVEIVEIIASFLAQSSPSSLLAAVLVSRTWYSASIQYVYERPFVTGRNYELFVRSVCPSINSHVRRNGLAENIRVLNLSRLVHNGSKSLTARLLGRVKPNLEEFVAPQASFAINSLAALSKCTRLKELDLTLVSQAIELPALLHTLRNLDCLQVLRLPRAQSSRPLDKPRLLEEYEHWPRHIEELHLNGSFTYANACFFNPMPNSMTRLWMGVTSYSSEESKSALISLIRVLGPQLRFFQILTRQSGFEVPYNHAQLLGYIHTHCLNLERLNVNINFMSSVFPLLNDASVPNYTRLDLRVEATSGLDMDASTTALANVENHLFRGHFPKVRQLGVDLRLRWHIRSHYQMNLTRIDDFLKNLAREDGSTASVPEAKAGVLVTRGADLMGVQHCTLHTVE